jgi:hypothetical protein
MPPVDWHPHADAQAVAGWLLLSLALAALALIAGLVYLLVTH